MSISFIRALRTHTSERFIVRDDDSQDKAIIDVHYLPNGNVAGTLIIIDEALAAPESINKLISTFDGHLLPMASLDDKSLSFTVVKGLPIGQFENDKQA